MALLQVQHISKKIGDDLIIDDVSFDQTELKKIAIAGESGSGKTTLLKMITGHIQPTGGKILFSGKKVLGPGEKLMPGHKSIAYLSQNFELLNHYRVEELIWFENKLEEIEARKLFGICRIDGLLHRKTNDLSGGEKQRIALCMLLVKHPVMLVLDEPFSNSDPIHTNILKAVLDEITERLRITCLLTSHDPFDTLSWADAIIVIRKGKLLQQGSPQELYHKPVNEYVAGLFGKYNLLKPGIASRFGIKNNGKHVMARPEHFAISKNGSGITGVIKKINFWGSFYEAEVMINDEKIIVRTTIKDLKPGEKVVVTVDN